MSIHALQFLCIMKIVKSKKSMSRFKTKQELLDEITKERKKFEDLLAIIPKTEKTVEVTDGMSVKDFLAHRTEWGRMMLHWYSEAKKGKTPDTPTEKYKWNQLNELNAEIYERFKNTPLATIEKDFEEVHDKLYAVIKKMSEEELFKKKFYDFTRTSDLATYLNSATAAHYRSAYKHINRWWKERL